MPQEVRPLRGLARGHRRVQREEERPQTPSLDRGLRRAEQRRERRKRPRVRERDDALVRPDKETPLVTLLVPLLVPLTSLRSSAQVFVRGELEHRADERLGRGPTAPRRLRRRGEDVVPDVAAERRVRRLRPGQEAPKGPERVQRDARAFAFVFAFAFAFVFFRDPGKGPPPRVGGE